MQRTLICSVLGVVALSAALSGVESTPSAATQSVQADPTWHTDLAVANAEAVDRGKPLLLVFR